MNRILRLSEKTAALSKWLSAGCLLVLVVIVIVDVLLRNLGILSLSGVSEAANYLQIGLVYLGLAFAYQDGSFIRMDLLLDRFRGRAERVRSIVIKALSIATVCLMLWFSLKTTLNSYEHSIVSIGVLRVELFIPQAVLCAGLLLFIVQMVLDLVIEICGPRAAPAPVPAVSSS
ncbi:TRAP transporter small permease [Leucobacter albus]|uniref:TRAP transporter small permease n=1 Tax=Leucobacter albus TaxID=272210 RepID=A0ABW3TMR5_9MICO